MAQAEATDPPPALAILSQRFGLSRFEREILLLCAGMELDTRIAGLCARAQADPARPYPTFALALTLFEEPSWEALGRAPVALLALARDQPAGRHAAHHERAARR